MSRDPLKSQTFKIWLAVGWLIFSSTMVVWWWRLGLIELSDHSKYTMLMSEGIFFLFAILGGGGSLIFMLIKDHRRQQQIKTFFSTFSHDLKTSISRLRLQADILREDSQLARNPSLMRLVKDINFLDLQLENSLNLSQGAQKLYIEEGLPLSKIIESLRSEWENIDISIDKEALIKGDRRALTSVFRNLFQNAVIHGSAEKITILVKAESNYQLKILVKDNGTGFKGEVLKLGQSQIQSKEDSGNGIGLYLCRSLLTRQNGDLIFENNPETGFTAQVLIPGVFFERGKN